MAGVSVLCIAFLRLNGPCRLSNRQCMINVSRLFSTSHDGSSIPPKPKRPISSFIRFTYEIREQNPGMKLTQQSALAGEKWRLLTDDQKAAYKPSAADIEAYNQNVVNWRASLTADQIQQLAEQQQKRKSLIAKRRIKKKQQELGMPTRGIINAFSAYVESKPIERGDAPAPMYIRGLSQLWQKMPADDKQPFVQKAEEARKKYIEELEQWEAKMVKEGHFDLVRAKSLPSHIDKKTRKPKKPKATKRKATRPKKVTKPRKKTVKPKKRDTKKSTTKKSTSPKKSTTSRKKRPEEDPSWMREE